jgi:hypothetical protein
MHVGYFDTDEGHHDLDDIVRIFFHLHDILIRIVFKMLQYGGAYQPPVIHMTAAERTDWVNVYTSASRLGY